MGVKNMIKRSLIITFAIFILCLPSFAGQTMHSGGVILKNKISPPYSETQIAPKIGGTSTLFSDDFEGTFPGTKWATGCLNTYLYYDAYWGQTSFKAYQGTKSVWCAAAGTAGVDPATHNYLDYMYACMVTGPFNLTNATAGTYSLHYWMKTEQDADYFIFGVSTDGNYYYGGMDSGDSKGWVSGSVDLSNVPVLGNVLGQSSVYIGCFFNSDYSVNDAGVYVDDVLLTVTTGGPTPTPTPTPVANLKLIIGNNQGTVGQTIPIQITVDNAANCKAFGFDLQFDTNKLAYISTAKGTATDNWADVNGSSITGGARVGGFAGSGNAVTGNAQEICSVNLQVKQAACPGADVSITAVNLKDCLNGATVQNGAITPICGEPTPTPTPIPGDLTIYILKKYLLGEVPLSQQQMTQADKNQDLIIDVADLIKMVIEAPHPTPTPTPTPAANPSLKIGMGSGAPSQSVEITIKTDDVNNCSAFGFDMQFDTTKLSFVTANKGTATNDWAAVSGSAITGGVRVGGFAGSGTPFSGMDQEICKVTLKVENAACPAGGAIELDAINLKDSLKGATVVKGSITATCGSSASSTKSIK